MVIEFRGEIQVLKTLLKFDAINITHLSKLIGQGHGQTKKHVAGLEKKGIVTVREYGAIRIIEINKDSPYYNAIKTLWGNNK